EHRVGVPIAREDEVVSLGWVEVEDLRPSVREVSDVVEPVVKMEVICTGAADHHTCVQIVVAFITKSRNHRVLPTRNCVMARTAVSNGVPFVNKYEIISALARHFMGMTGLA